MYIPTQPRILGIGVVVIDHILTVDRYPQPDSKNEATASRLQVGGPVPTALAWLNHLGHSTHFAGAWGEDALGNLIEQQLTQDRTGFQISCREQIATPVTQVWLEAGTGQRTLVTHRPQTENIAARITADFLKPFNVLHLDCWPGEAALKAATLMQEQGGLVCVDTGSPKPGVEKLLQLADVVNAPRRFIEDFCNAVSLEEGAKSLARFGPQMVTVTDGANGAVLYASGEVHGQPAVEAANIVDTNGAGDVFSAGLIHAVLSKQTPLEALRTACELAATKCQQMGNRPGP